MPLYEYRCQACGTFEQMQRFSDPPLGACPTCEGPVEKLLSAPAIQFKGSGWYVTDYARKSTEKDAGGQEKGASKESPSADAKADSSKPSSSGADSKASGTRTDKK